jgi:hypothetical protein
MRRPSPSILIVTVALADLERERLTTRKRNVNADPGASVAGGSPTFTSRGSGARVAAPAGPAAAANAASTTAVRVAVLSPRTRPYGKGAISACA